MKIHEIEASEVSSWARLAAEHMVELRTASGALSLTSAGDFIHRVLTQFKVGTPVDSRIFINDDGTNWLWLETKPELRVVDAKIDDATNMEWVEAFETVAQGGEVAYECFSGATPFLLSFPQRECGIEMVADVNALVRENRTGQRIILRPMYSGEVMKFMVTAANQRGKALSLVKTGSEANALKRDAFREIERLLPDGIFTPGHSLYSICTDDKVIGNAWLECDSGSGKVHSIVLNKGSKTDEIRKAVVIALADAAKSEGMRRLLIPLTPFERQMYDSVVEIGMRPARRYARIAENAAQHVLAQGELNPVAVGENY